jgi:hypothetical protein
MFRRAFITEGGDQRLYELKSGVGSSGVMENESEYTVLSLVSENDGLSMQDISTYFIRASRGRRGGRNLDYWIAVFDRAVRDNYISIVK